MKPVRDMSRLELAGFIAGAFKAKRISVVLSGGSCVSIYSGDRYVSMDLDFVNAGFTKRSLIKSVMESLGFQEENRYFRHPDTPLLIEFPPGPLGIGDEPVKQIVEMDTGVGVLRLLSPTDCVKDRLSWYYHGGDTECLEQAILVARANPTDLKEVERWSRTEGKSEAFSKIVKRLKANGCG